jgi:hypothetical protein
MGMFRATICKLSEDFDYEKLGEVIWDRKEIRVDRENPELSRIAAEPSWLRTPDKVEEFNPKDDPEAWILNLHRRYPSPQYQGHSGRFNKTQITAGCYLVG